MFGKKKPIPTYEDCPNTVLASKRGFNGSGSGVELSFSCPRIPLLKAKENQNMHGRINIERAKVQLGTAIGGMCVNCTFRDKHYSPKSESVVTADGAILETVEWVPVQGPEASQSTQVSRQE